MFSFGNPFLKMIFYESQTIWFDLLLLKKWFLNLDKKILTIFVLGPFLIPLLPSLCSIKIKKKLRGKTFEFILPVSTKPNEAQNWLTWKTYQSDANPWPKANATPQHKPIPITRTRPTDISRPNTPTHLISHTLLTQKSNQIQIKLRCKWNTRYIHRIYTALDCWHKELITSNLAVVFVRKRQFRCGPLFLIIKFKF